MTSSKNIIASLMLTASVLFAFNASAQLTGAYTIDATQPTGGTNFQSFTEFSAALTADGVSGPVAATVAPGSGPYTEQVTFQSIAGIGASAPITIDGNGVTMTSDTAIDQQGGDDPNRHIIRLVGMQHFTISNLHIERFPGSTGFIAIQGLTSGNDITISNCSVDMGSGTSSLLAAFVFNGDPTSVITEGGMFDHITIHNNTVTGGGYGVSIFGLEAPNLATNVVIHDNSFTSFHSNGVYIRESDGVVIRDNQFDKASSQVTSVNAIQLAQANNVNGRIYNNVIKVSQTDNGTMTVRGIYSFDGTGHRIYNNVIHDVKLTFGDFIGIAIRNPGTEVYFNTIVLDETASSDGDLFGIAEEGLSNTGTIVRNNLVSITQPTTGIKAALALGATANLATAFSSNYNVLWVPGGNVAVKQSTTPMLYATLAQWQGASLQDANSLNIDPQFGSSLPLIPTNPFVDNAGVAVTGITTDIQGVLRGNPPTIGAYEINCTLPETPTALNVDSTVCANTAYTFSVNPVVGATSYNWEVPIGTTVTAGQGTSEVTITFGTTSGNVVVFANDSTCGTGLPAQFMVTVDECSGVKNVAMQTAFVYPNPFSQNASLELPGNAKTVDVKLFDATGRMVQSFTARGARFAIERNGLVDGVYTMEISDVETTIARVRLVIR